MSLVLCRKDSPAGRVLESGQTVARSGLSGDSPAGRVLESGQTVARSGLSGHSPAGRVLESGQTVARSGLSGHSPASCVLGSDSCGRVWFVWDSLAGWCWSLVRLCANTRCSGSKV